MKGTHTLDWFHKPLTASSSPLRLGLPSASPNESSVGGSVASVGGSLTWEAEDLEGELCLGAGVGATGEEVLSQTSLQAGSAISQIDRNTTVLT